MDDVRIWAVVLVIVGLLLGVFVGVSPLLIATIVLVVLGVIAILWVGKDAHGTSGTLGFAILVIGGLASLLIPAWIAWLIKTYGPS